MNRSLVLLPAFVLVALLLTVLYALFGLRGPQTVLREARQAMDHEHYERAIHLLNAAADAIGDAKSGLREQVLRMRVDTYKHLGLREKALEDIRTLFEVFDVSDRDLMIKRIRTLNELAAEVDDGAALAKAWELAEKWLARHPGDAVVLAEAGTAKELEGQRLFDDWATNTCDQAPPEDQKELRRLMYIAVYSTASPRIRENQVRTLSDAMERIVSQGPSETTPSVARVRAVALAARDLFLRSMATGDMDPLAYSGLANQLRRAAADDTLLMLAHSFVNRARPVDQLVAAVDIADIHLRHGRFKAAIKICERVLPLGTLRQKYDAGQLDHNAIRLLLCRTMAILGTGDAAQGRRLVTDYITLVQNDDQAVDRALQTWPLAEFLFGMLLENQDRQRAHLVNLVNNEEMRDYPWNRRTLLDAAYRKLVTLCDPVERQTFLQNWMNAVPDAVTPLHDLARLHSVAGNADQAIPLLEHALRALPMKEKTLQLLVEAQLTQFKGDLDEAIVQASNLANSVPDELGPYPALILAAARRALEMEHLDVALGCCDRARQLFPETRTPIYLKAEILIAKNQPEQADQVMKQLLLEDPSDRKALALRLQAREAAGKPSGELRFESLLRGMPDLKSTRYLARRWLERGEYERVLMLTQNATEQFGVDLEMQVLATRAMLKNPKADEREILKMLRAVYHLARNAGDSAREARLSRWVLAQYVLVNPDKASDAVRTALLDKFLQANESAEDLEELAEALVKKGDSDLALRAYADLVGEERYADYREGKHLIAAGHLWLQTGNRPRARATLKAALGFEGGEEAEIEIALLAKLDGDTHEFSKPPLVDSIRSACLTPDRESAVEYLEDLLQSNPDNLSAQLVLAVFKPNDKLSPRVRSIANVAGEDLVLLVALLQDKAFAEDALIRVRRLLDKYPGDAVLAILEARANANADNAAQVRPSLNRARQAMLEETTLSAEALDILASSHNPLINNSKIMDFLTAHVLKEGPNASPALAATLVRNRAAVLDVPGVRREILPIVAGFWLKHTKLSGAGLAEAQILIDEGELATAIRLLRNLEPLLDKRERSRFLEMYFSTMRRFRPRAEPLVVDEMAKTAIKVLNTECVHGAPLHFLLGVLDDQIERLAGTAVGEAARERMLALESDYLLRHIAYFEAGGDTNVDNLVMTLRRYGRREGFDRGLKKVDETLRKDPSLLPVWLLRADWLVQLLRDDEAVTSLEWLPRYLQDPLIVDTLIQLMCRSGILVEMGQGLLKNEGLMKASKLSLGMVQLRLGEYVHAAQAMQLARPKSNADHIYYRAMALLGVGTDKPMLDARRLLVQLVEKHGESSHVESARTVLRAFASDGAR